MGDFARASIRRGPSRWNAASCGSRRIHFVCGAELAIVPVSKLRNPPNPKALPKLRRRAQTTARSPEQQRELVGATAMAFLLEEEAAETLAAALSFLDDQQEQVTQQEEPTVDDESAVLPSLDDPEAAEVLDALSTELPALTAPASRGPKALDCEAVVTPKRTFGRRGKSRQVAPCPPLLPQTSAALTLPTTPATTGSTQKKVYVRKKPLSYNPNKARDERKLELLYLRKKVTDMEMELQGLQKVKGNRSVHGGSLTAAAEALNEEVALARPASPATSSDSTFNDDDVPRVWEKLCVRQLERRVKAERENARLKMVLEGQIKIAKSMEQILKKRMVLRAMEACGSNKRTKRTHAPQSTDRRSDAKIFEMLMAGIETSYREADAVFEANGLGRTEAPKSDAKMRDGVNGMYLELFANKMLPFGMHATGEAVWQHFKGTKDIPYRWYHSKSAGSIESTEDSIVECFGMEMYDAKSNTTAEFNVKQILRRYVEEDRVVVVWRSHIEPLEYSNKRFAGIHFQEKGYVVIKPRRSGGAFTAGDDEFTLLQTCYIITPDLSDQTLNDDAKTGALTEFVMSSTAANISASHEMIENVLLDQALQKRGRM